MLTPFGAAGLLGAIQGLATFLPISSTGHLALLQILFRGGPSPAELGALHAGTLVAMLVVLRRQIFAAASSAVSLFRRSGAASGADALFVVVGIGPAAAVAGLLHDTARRFAASPLAVAFGLLVTGAVLVASRSAPAGMRDHPSLAQTLVLGAALGAGVLPGVSGTAATVALALLFGVRRVRAFELSMLLLVPMELAASLSATEGGRGMRELTLLFVCAATAFLTGALGLRVLRRSLIRGFFPLFALWVVPLAFATAALAWAWPLRV